MNVDVLKDVLQDMMEKWLSYFENFPSIYGVACIIDLVVRVEGLRKLLQFYYVSLNRPTYDVDGYIESCKRNFYMIFTITTLLYITRGLQVTIHHLKVYKHMIHLFLIFSIVKIDLLLLLAPPVNPWK